MLEPLAALVFWEGTSGRNEAVICDVGLGGCYLNTKIEGDIGEQVSVEIPTSTASERVIIIKGTIVPQQRKFKGFGLRFEALSEEQQTLITGLMVQCQEEEDRRGLER